MVLKKTSRWHEMLCDEPLILDQAAIKKHIATCKFAPRVSEILDLVEHQKWELWCQDEIMALYLQTGARKEVLH